MKLDFVKLSPSRNMTLLVTTPVDRALHCTVAEQLMAYDSVNAEQVGFLESPSLEGARIRLQMMGGEFCGNATMSLGAFLAFQDGLSDGAEADYPLEVSGAEGIVHCRIRRRGSVWQGTVSMPAPEKIEECTLPGGYSCPVVFFPGIAHAIIDTGQMSRAQAEEYIAQWCEATGQEAFGIILRQENRIEPLVYVRKTNSAVWEQGCGSGTAAVGALEAHRRGESIVLEIAQPGGVIRVDACPEDDGIRIRITGIIKISAVGQAWVE